MHDTAGDIAFDTWEHGCQGRIRPLGVSILQVFAACASQLVIMIMLCSLDPGSLALTRTYIRHNDTPQSSYTLYFHRKWLTRSGRSRGSSRGRSRGRSKRGDTTSKQPKQLLIPRPTLSLLLKGAAITSPLDWPTHPLMRKN
jgi:hypothetical protein